jgi:protein-tyrosine phosphatase
VIDTHCHLLPGLDDGPAMLEESVELAIEMTAQGVTRAVCTPHLSRQFPVSHARAVAALRVLEPELERRNVDLALTLAAEVTDVNAVTLDGPALRERSIAGKYLVVELAPSSTAASAELLGRRLGAMGLVPVVAHPERVPAFGRDPGSIDGVRALGGLVQVMASSLTGRWGESVEQVAWEMLAAGRVDLVASDAHGTQRRRCHLDEARELVCSRLQAAYWDELTTVAPTRLLAGA